MRNSVSPVETQRTQPMRTTGTALVTIGVVVLLAGCASQYAPERMSDPYGFFSGVWHGMIFVFALMAKLISWVASLIGVSLFDSVTIIGRPNTGFFYYWGFALGLCTIGGTGYQAR